MKSHERLTHIMYVWLLRGMTTSLQSMALVCLCVPCRYQAAKRAMSLLCQAESLGLTQNVITNAKELYRCLAEVRPDHAPCVHSCSCGPIGMLLPAAGMQMHEGCTDASQR